MGRVKEKVSTPRDPVGLRIISFRQLFRPTTRRSLRGISARTVASTFTRRYFVFFPTSEQYLETNDLRIVEDVIPIFCRNLCLLRAKIFTKLRRLSRHRFVFRIIRSGCVLVWCMRRIKDVIFFVIHFRRQSILGMARNVRDHVSRRSTSFPIESFSQRALRGHVRNLHRVRYSNRYHGLTFSVEGGDNTFPIVSSSAYRQAGHSMEGAIFVPVGVKAFRWHQFQVGIPCLRMSASEYVGIARGLPTCYFGYVIRCSQRLVVVGLVVKEAS